MEQSPRPTRPGMPRWMVVVAVLLALAAGVAVWLGTRPPTGGLEADEPLVHDEVAMAIADARALAVAGDIDGGRGALDAALSGPFSPDALGYREIALLEWEHLVLDFLAPDRTVDLETAVLNAFASVADARAPRRPGEAFGRNYSYSGEAERLLMSRIPDGLDDRDAPSHALACAYLDAVLQGGGSSGGAVFEHVLEMGDAGPQAIPAVLVAHARAGRHRVQLRRTIRALLSQLPADAVEMVLAATAQDERCDVLTRRACEHWLGEVADLPLAMSPYAAERDLMRDSFPEGEILAAWKRLRALPRADAYRERLELAAAEFAVARPSPTDRRMPEDAFRRAAPRAEVQALQGWVGRHTGLTWGRQGPAELVAFLGSDVDVLGTLLTAGGLSPTDTEPLTILAAMDAKKGVQPYLHQCLTLLVDDGVTPPTWLAGSSSSRELVKQWRAALGIPPERMPLRVSHWALQGGRWSLVGQDQMEVIENAPQVSTECEFVLMASRPELAFDARVPGTSWSAEGPPGMHKEIASAALVRVDDGLQLQGGYQYNRMTTGHGGSSSSQGERWTVPFTISPTVGVGSTSTPDWFRNRLTLLRPEPPAAVFADLGEGPWDEVAWRTAIAADLGRLADLADVADPWWEFHNVHQRTLWNLSAVCMTLHVPEALPALRRLLEVAPKWESGMSTDLLLLAALRSGADDLTDTPVVRSLAKGSGVDDVVQGTIGPGPKYWLRLLFDAETPEMRDLAVSAILAQQAEWSEELGDDLHAAIESGQLQAVPELTTALARSPGGSATTFGQAVERNAPLVALAALLNLAVLLLLFVAIPGLARGDAWPRVGALLVALGVAYSAFSLRVMGVQLVPTGVGLLAAALGAWGLRTAVRTRAATVAVVAFALGALASWLWSPAEGVLTFVAVVAVTVLGRDVFALVPPVRGDAGPRRPRTRAAPRLILLALVLSVAGAIVVTVLAQGELPAIVATVLVAGAVGWLLGILAPTMVRFDPASPRRALAPLFVLFYVLPMAARLVAAALVGAGAAEPWDLGGMELFAAIALPASAVLWSLGRLIDGTRLLAVR